MKILITGIHGFVGSNLVEVLSKFHTLYGIDIVTPEVKGISKTFFWNDLVNNRLPELDVIIHLAGKAHDTKNRSLVQSYFDINYGLTQKVYDYFLCSSAKKFIFFSSVKAAADHVIDDFLTEDVVPCPKGPYGESKIAAENYILSKISEEKRVYILRPSMIHGPGNKGNLNLLYKIAIKGFPWPLGAFDNKRSFTSIKNLQYIIHELIERDIDSGVYNISDDETLSTNDIIKLIADSLGKKHRIWSLSKNVFESIARCGDMLKLPLNSERLKKLTESYVVSNAKIKEALNIRKMPIAADDGMRYTLDSFKAK